MLAPLRNSTRMTQINDISQLVLGKKSYGFAEDDWNHGRSRGERAEQHGTINLMAKQSFQRERKKRRVV